MGTPGYEFDTQQNNIIEQLARAMRWIAFPLRLVGALYAIGAILAVVQAIPQREPAAYLGVLFGLLAAFFFSALGRWTGNAAESFHRITTTTGQDVDHLMDGLDNLRKMYSLLSVIVKVYVAILLAVVLVGLFVLIVALVQR
jgi:hypothetical protein